LAAPLTAPSRCRARLRGPVANVEIGLQKAGYLYEIVPGDTLPHMSPDEVVRAKFTNWAARRTSTKVRRVPLQSIIVFVHEKISFFCTVG
jgi:hypothetical protein